MKGSNRTPKPEVVPPVVEGHGFGRVGETAHVGHGVGGTADAHGEGLVDVEHGGEGAGIARLDQRSAEPGAAAGRIGREFNPARRKAS